MRKNSAPRRCSDIVPGNSVPTFHIRGPWAKQTRAHFLPHSRAILTSVLSRVTAVDREVCRWLSEGGGGKPSHFWPTPLFFLPLLCSFYSRSFPSASVCCPTCLRARLGGQSDYVLLNLYTPTSQFVGRWLLHCYVHQVEEIARAMSF